MPRSKRATLRMVSPRNLLGKYIDSMATLQKHDLVRMFDGPVAGPGAAELFRRMWNRRTRAYNKMQKSFDKYMSEVGQIHFPTRYRAYAKILGRPEPKGKSRV